MSGMSPSSQQNSRTTVTQVESDAREPDHAICQGESSQAGFGIRLAFLHFGVYAFTGDMRMYHCSNSLTVHALAAGLYGGLILLDE